MIAGKAGPIALALVAVAASGAFADTKVLTGDSTLAEWQQASATERSQVAVALAKNRLAPDASKLDVAKTAMEISGCLSATAKDSRLGAWKVAPTATTCLDAPEREAKK